MRNKFIRIYAIVFKSHPLIATPQTSRNAVELFGRESDIPILSIVQKEKKKLLRGQLKNFKKNGYNFYQFGKVGLFAEGTIG